MKKLSGLALMAWMSAATVAWAAGPRTVYTNKQAFTVPIRMDDADRAAIRTLKFFVKPPSGSWMLVETGGPSTSKFNYSSNGDGEHAFTFVTEDQAGRLMPSHPSVEPPRLLVVVDTKAPELAVETLRVASGQMYVQCSMKDSNPDPESIIAEAGMADGTWLPMVAMGKEMPGVFRCPDTGVPSKVRVTGKDRAQNAATQIVALTDVKPIVPATPAPMTVINAAPPVVPVPAPAVPMPAPVAAPMPAPAIPVPAPTAAATTPALPVPEVSSGAMPLPAGPSLVPAPALTNIAEKPSAPLTPPPGPARQLLHTTRCSLAYSLDGVSPAALQKVEAYITRDEGQTWQKLSDDPNRTSPIELTMPGDGLFGVVLVVHTQQQPGQPPARGEAPDWWLEVDTVPPEVRIESAQVGTGDEAGHLLLNWTVRDRNQAPDSVELAWAPAADGPWQSIAKGLRSDGQYRWPVPKEAFGRVYLKLEAADKAGNLGKYVTPQPIVTESAKPKARVIGINPAAVRQ